MMKNLCLNCAMFTHYYIKEKCTFVKSNFGFCQEKNGTVKSCQNKSCFVPKSKTISKELLIKLKLSQIDGLFQDIYLLNGMKEN